MDSRRSALLKSLVVIAGLGSAWPSGVSSAEVTRTCAYAPGSGKPNPLGMRASITATEQQGTSTFVYKHFPEFVPGGQGVTIAVRRELTFPDTSMDEARMLLRDRADYYKELVGYADPEGFAPFDDVMVCAE